MSSFYITLPSNSSFGYFPNNKVSDFTTKLPQNIDLSGKWEVGLVEMQWPINWFNLQESDSFLILTAPTGIATKIAIGGGHYPGASTLVSRINRRIKKITGKQDVVFEYDNLEHKIKVKTRQDVVELSKPLGELMGFKSNKIHEKGLVHDICSNCAVDMRHGINSLYIYSDIIQCRTVGDSSVPLLRVIPASGTHGEIQSVSYLNVHYLPLQKKCFDTIQIYIADDAGELVPFEGGRSVVTLHFRRVPLS